jgi:hypothetical protein
VFGAKARPKSTIQISDARLLGLVAWSFTTINSGGYEAHFLRADREQFEIQSGSDNGEPVWKVRYRITGRQDPTFTEYWLASDKGGLPVSIEVWTGENDKRSGESLKAKLGQYAPKGIWFPKEVVFRKFHGAKVRIEEIATVEEAQFDKAIPDGTFTLSGLGLPKGRVVDVDGRLMIWTGERLRPKTHGEEEGLGPHEPEPPSRLRTALLVLNSVLLACIAAGLLWLRWRRNKKASGALEG